MELETALTKISYAIRGLDDDAPSFGDAEAVYWLSILNDKKDELYSNPNISWDVSFKSTQPDEVGTVSTAGGTTLTGTGTYFTDYKAGDTILVSGETVRTIDSIASDTSLEVTVAFSNTASELTFTRQPIIEAGVQSYSINRNLINPSDNVNVVADQTRYFEFVIPAGREDTEQKVYISGVNPMKLTFTKTIDATDDIVDGVLNIPGYYMPKDISEQTDLLPFSDPNWGIMATAAQVAFNDIVYEDKAGDLQNKANDLYKHMIRAQQKGTYQRGRRIPYNVKNRIINPRNVY